MEKIVDLAMSVLVSLMLLVGALYVVLSNSYDQDTRMWAMGIVGMVIGAWLPRVGRSVVK